MTMKSSKLLLVTSLTPTRQPRDHARRRVEAETGKPIDVALLEALRKEEGNVSAVARRFSVDRVTVYDWMRQYGIERRAVFTAL